jgi:thioredoxin-dependent peroxiredoxin
MKPTTTTSFPKLFTLLALAVAVFTANAAEPPKVGDAAPDFTLNTLDGKAVTLSRETAKRPVVLVVLRGWPGYQCPICTRQVQEFSQQANALAGKAQVLMVYPGPAADLKAHAQDFLNDKHWPEQFLFVTDPDYIFTQSYGLRWDAKGETAYPSTFIIDAKGKVQFAKVSKGHGGRSSAAEVVKAVDEIK